MRENGMCKWTEQELRSEMTSKDCRELRELITENPDLPLVVFVSEDAYVPNGCAYCAGRLEGAQIQELTLYHDKQADETAWVERGDYEELLESAMCEDSEYDALSDEEFEKMLSSKMEAVPFVRAIAVYIR